MRLTRRFRRRLPRKLGESISVVAGPCNVSKSTARRPSDSRFKGSETSEGRGPRNGFGVFHAEVAGGRPNDPVNTGEVHPRGADPRRYVRLVSPPISPLAGPTRGARSILPRPSLDPRCAAALTESA